MMPENTHPERATFGLLPEPERSPGSFVASAVINGLILAVFLYMGAMVKKVIEQHRFEETMLLLPTQQTPPPKVKAPPPPPAEQPVKLPEMQYDAPKISMPRPEPKPDLKPIQLEAKLTAPLIKGAKPQVILAPQPKAALGGAAMPAQDSHVRFSTAPVHLGQTFGVTPNPNARGPATVAAIGNPYGGMQGPAVAPHGKVGSTGFGNGSRIGSSAGRVGRVASAGVSGATVATPSRNVGRVASAGVPSAPTAMAAAPLAAVGPPPTNLVVISKPKPEYTSEAKQLRVQGDVVLRVTFTASGQIVVHNIVRGLGHGLDEEARRVAQQIRFRPATRNGQAVDMTTNIIITFQLA